ncbi:cystatin-B-like [Brachionus plicatilis]|uniref:Cystatin-B-like n=1 Tax=Brachionus plicatilis TaxID=10195 RepID=A0A3M7R9L4_BRAPC|nr:cystatin-B-like [Brachionus plicatilis]
MRLGGIGHEKPADQNVQHLVDQLSHEIQIKTGKRYPFLKAVSFKTQIVAGTNYFIKVQAGQDYLHLRVFQPLPCYSSTPQLASFELSKSSDDPIEYF